jgi:hypothetical protein
VTTNDSEWETALHDYSGGSPATRSAAFCSVRTAAGQPYAISSANVITDLLVAVSQLDSTPLARPRCCTG